MAGYPAAAAAVAAAMSHVAGYPAAAVDASSNAAAVLLLQQLLLLLLLLPSSMPMLSCCWRVTADCEKLPPPVLPFQNVSFSYSGNEEGMLYKDLEFGIDCDSRIALVGPNGAGVC